MKYYLLLLFIAFCSILSDNMYYVPTTGKDGNSEVSSASAIVNRLNLEREVTYTNPFNLGMAFLYDIDPQEYIYEVGEWATTPTVDKVADLSNE